MRSLLFCFLPATALASPNPDVTVSDVKGLLSAVASIGPGKTILLAPGHYVLPNRMAIPGAGTSSAPALIASLRGLGTVTIDANGAEEAFLVNGGSFLRFEGLTITGGACHALKVDPPSTDVVIINNRFYDNTRTGTLASQVSAVKGDPGAVRVTVENNIVEQIASYGGGNFQGIDCNAGVDWVVRGNTVRDIRGAGLSGSGIQFKSGSTGTVIENNLVLRCGLNGIVYGGFGNPAWGKQKFEHVGGVVRNNVVAECADAGITVINTSDGKVVNNTLYNNGHNPDVRIVARNLEFRNNILDWPIECRDGTMAAKLNNAVLRKPSDGSWFVNAAGADFRLRSDAPLAPDLGATLSKKPSRSGGGRSSLKQGHEALARGDLAKAYKYFEAALADGGDEDLVAQARDAMQKIEQAALGRLKEAQALEAIGESADAIAAYQDLLREFAGVPAAQEARQRLDALKKAPPARK
jgi:parallel beta-helix repeat protein